MKPAPLLILLVLFTAKLFSSHAQSASPSEVDGTRQQVTALRDAFVRDASSVGFTCPLAPPMIVISDIASFGNYDEKRNRLTTPAWNQLTKDEKSIFFHLAGSDTDEAAAQRVFENGTHRWVFIHEMGHWSQRCRNRIKGRTHYAVEYEANRIAAAYWRKMDPRLMAGLAHGFDSMLENQPSPIPHGQTVETYFNEHYKKLAHTPDYTWFQAHMVTAAYAETPTPTFKEALEQIGKP